jgi:hypothetical protein
MQEIKRPAGADNAAGMKQKLRLSAFSFDLFHFLQGFFVVVPPE